MASCQAALAPVLWPSPGISEQRAASPTQAWTDPFHDERQVPPDHLLHLTQNNEHPEPPNSQEAGVIIMENFDYIL